MPKMINVSLRSLLNSYYIIAEASVCRQFSALFHNATLGYQIKKNVTIKNKNSAVTVLWLSKWCKIQQ